jgi:hypothetical protein
MSKKPNLTLVEPIIETKKVTLKEIEARNFWNTCPRKLENLPCEACSLGKQSSEAPTEELEICSWSVTDTESHYCFWVWIHNQSLPNGKMDLTQQQHIAKLLGEKSSDIHFCIKEAVQKLRDNENIDILKEFDTGKDYEVGVGLGYDVVLNPTESEE